MIFVPFEALIAVALAIDALGVDGTLDILALIAGLGGRARAHAGGLAAVDLALASGPECWERREGRVGVAEGNSRFLISRLSFHGDYYGDENRRGHWMRSRGQVADSE